MILDIMAVHAKVVTFCTLVGHPRQDSSIPSIISSHMRWLQLGRLRFDCTSTALRLFDDCVTSYDRMTTCVRVLH